jgi:hypothetical protein
LSRDFIEAFEGPNGKAEVFEVVTPPSGGLGVEKVEYEVEFNGAVARTVLSMGEASVVACELSGNPRFLSPTA